MAARRDAAPIYAPLSIVSLMDYTAAPERRRSQFTILWNTCGKANCTDDQLLSHLRKAICQHKFGSSKPPKPIDILVSETSGFYSVLSRPAFPSFAHFLVDHGKKIFVELWAEDDLSSPTHVFTNGAGGFFSANLLRVEARLVSSDGVATDKSCTFDARLCTDRCVRHFRKGFERQLAQKCGLPVDTPVEVHFKKPHGTATGYTPGSSKETFEFKVAQCLRQNDALQVQVRVKGSKDAAMDVDTTPEKLKQAAGKGDSSRMIKPIPATAVSATKPIWSSTESKIPGAWMNAGSSITTEPYATTSINASTSHTTATPINTVPLVDMRSSYKADSGPPPLPPKPIGVGSYERTIPGSFFGSSATTLATSSSVPAPAPKQNGNLNGETAAQTQEQQPVSYAAARDTVQTMLSSFLVELNRTLAANFGDDFSEVSMGGKEPASTSPAEKESPAESQYESAAQPAVEPKLATSGVVTAAGYAPVPPAQQPPEVKHNACCDVCGSSIKGIRHKC